MADEPATTPDGGQPADAGTTDPPKSFTQEQLDKIVQERLGKERSKFANYDELKSAAEELQKLKDANKSELEKAQGRISELEQTTAGHDRATQELRVENSILRHAGKAGISDPGAAAKLLDWSQIEYDDSGQPKNMPKLLEGLGKDYPGLLGEGQRRTTADGGVRQPVGASDMDALIRRSAGRA